MSIKNKQKQQRYTFGDMDQQTGEKRCKDDDHRDEDKHTRPEVTFQKMQTTSQRLLRSREN